jgi:hypothetical protein
MSIGVSARAQTLDRLTTDVEDLTCILDIDGAETKIDVPVGPIERHKVKAPGLIRDYQLTIDCSKSGTTTSIHYDERYFDFPIAAFRLSDDPKHMITLWQSGSAYHVRIYSFNRGKISKTFDQGTKTPPQFGYGSAGQLIVLLDNPIRECDGRAKKVSSIWLWTGDRFIQEGPCDLPGTQ